jgi:hypothetical protein
MSRNRLIDFGRKGRDTEPCILDPATFARMFEKLDECLGIGEARPVHDDLARFEILVNRGAGTATAARTVEAQPSRPDQKPLAGSRSLSITRLHALGHGVPAPSRERSSQAREHLRKIEETASRAPTPRP